MRYGEAAIDEPAALLKVAEDDFYDCMFPVIQRVADEYEAADVKIEELEIDLGELTMEEVSDMVGFANRQSFYASFYKFMNMTPREYRMKHFENHPSQKVKRTKSKTRKQHV